MARPLWHDEIFTVWISRLPFASQLAALRADSGPPLFYLLERPIVLGAEAGGITDRAARLLPFLAALLVFAGARALPRGRERTLFLVLVATSPLLLLFAAEARAYALLALVDFALYGLAACDRPTRRRLVAVAAGTVAALYLHYLAAFFVASLGLLLAARRRWSSVGALLTGTILFLPWLPILRSQPQEAVSWIRQEPGRSALGFLSALGGAGFIPAPFGQPLPGWLLAVGIAAALLALAALGRTLTTRSEEGDASAVTLLCLAAILGASVFRPVAFPGRSEMAVMPVWLFAIAAAARRSRLGHAAAVAVAAVGAMSAVFLLVRAPRASSDSRPLLEAVVQRARPGDVLVAGAGFYLPARLSVDRREIPVTLWSFPPELERHPGWFRPAPPTPADGRWLAEKLAAAPRDQRVFFLLHPLYATRTLGELLAARGRAVTLEIQPNGLLLLWTAAGTAPGRLSGGPAPASPGQRRL